MTSTAETENTTPITAEDLVPGALFWYTHPHKGRIVSNPTLVCPHGDLPTLKVLILRGTGIVEAEQIHSKENFLKNIRRPIQPDWGYIQGVLVDMSYVQKEIDAVRTALEARLKEFLPSGA